MADVSLSTLHVIVPDPSGALTVCSLEMLIEALMEESPTLGSVLDHAGIDQLERWSFGDAERTNRFVERVRALNESGDAAAYWSVN